MSMRQAQICEERMSLQCRKSLVLSSVFDDETLDFIKHVRTNTPVKEPKIAMLGSGTWIKGVEQTEAWLKVHKKDYAKLPQKPYREFLQDMARYETFAFMPLDYDTCPRTVIEAKLLGMNLILNDNVLHRDEPWFTGDIDNAEEYLRLGHESFWNAVLSL